MRDPPDHRNAAQAGLAPWATAQVRSAFADGQPAAVEEAGAPARAGPDWLRSVLTVSGPAAAAARFREAARGTGAIPWHLDLDHEEARLLAPMAAAGLEARLLARALREVIAARHERVLALWSQPGRCPLDLHRLIPVPDSILQLGEDAPAARTWLWTHWGTPRPLRQVRVVDDQPDRRLRRSARIVLEFRSADWTPWQAILRLRRDWPRLIFDVRPHYDDGGPAAAGGPTIAGGPADV